MYNVVDIVWGVIMLNVLMCLYFNMWSNGLVYVILILNLDLNIYCFFKMVYCLNIL